MLFKVFYQESKTRSPKREQTKVMFLELDTDSFEAGQVMVRELIATHTPYQLEFIDPISDAQADYERTAADFTVTTF